MRSYASFLESEDSFGKHKDERQASWRSICMVTFLRGRAALRG